ncbi:peptidoglycan DD-metalloendopeptidase family protein [uncultured Kriegella sp.]|uniref:murein hydrolase activator EnvC family protein n=1 Tax=uncultured Kriegella sp. TaxID=1798910 RepID=UPI0030D74160|tara:strand:+ start:210420 stop:211652 length:1233 start_codon:yes stop_codon:yes gene_type:complete
MIYRKLHIAFVSVVAFFLMCADLQAQTEEQRTLEIKREQLQKEITEINRLLFAEKKEKGTVLDQMEALDKKMSVRQQLINVTNQQSALLNKQINGNISSISKLRGDLKELKNEYSLMIRKSYQNSSKQSRLMFLLSSENFLQAFKRLQYMKQYADHRREQGQQIVVKTDELTQLNRELTVQRKEKELLIADNQKAKAQMMKEMKDQKALLGSIRKNESKYVSAIKKKTKESKEIERQIDKLIRDAIVSANKNTGKKALSASKFVLTPEAMLVANSFSANKGKLIWPVEKGIKSQGFGVYSDAVYPGIKHESNGVIITTDQGAKARSIFKGEVIAILAVPGGNKGVSIKHGNYISTYYNLSELFVKKGDKVSTKTELGTIYTNRFNGQTRLKFYLYEDTSKLNPEEWVYQL